MKSIGKKGATLAEIVVSLAILGIIMAPISLVFYMGYSNYFIENDRMAAQQAAKEVLEKIIEDLRLYENEFTEVDSITGKAITIRDGVHYPDDEIVYTLSEEQKKVLRNGASVLSNDDNILIIDFSVLETKPSGYDSSVITISITVKVGKSNEINLESSYRRKSR